VLKRFPTSTYWINGRRISRAIKMSILQNLSASMVAFLHPFAITNDEEIHYIHHCLSYKSKKQEFCVKHYFKV